jgi:hypothetical protein
MRHRIAEFKPRQRGLMRVIIGSQHSAFLKSAPAAVAGHQPMVLPNYRAAIFKPSDNSVLTVAVNGALGMVGIEIL